MGQIDASAFDGFDYVALGHIHASYCVGRETVRYAGSPLCYHFDETRQAAKGPILVELGAKGDPVKMETQILPALHPMRELRGKYEELRDLALADLRRGEYLRIVLTDRRITQEISAFFQELYSARDSVVLEIVSEYSPFHDLSSPASAGTEPQSLEDLFAAFYAERRGGDMPDERESEALAFAGELTRHAEGGVNPSQEQIGKLLAFLMEQEEKR